MNVVTADQGFNRFTWGVQHQNGFGAPPGRYTVKVSLGATMSKTVPLTVLVDPRLAAEGITAEDLQEQFAHNTRMREMVAEVNALVARARVPRRRASRTVARRRRPCWQKVEAVNKVLLTEPVRYGKPGLQAHISYLSRMTTRVDQKVGRDATRAVRGAPQGAGRSDGRAQRGDRPDQLTTSGCVAHQRCTRRRRATRRCTALHQLREPAGCQGNEEGQPSLPHPMHAAALVHSRIGRGGAGWRQRSVSHVGWGL
jgi:hypothetical protein